MSLSRCGAGNGSEAAEVAIGSSVGAVIETYDSTGSALPPACISGDSFFPNSSPSLARWPCSPRSGSGSPLAVGGIIGGHLGDKVGRKPVLVASLIVMELATSSSACCPPTPPWASGPDPAGDGARLSALGVRRRVGRGSP